MKEKRGVDMPTRTEQVKATVSAAAAVLLCAALLYLALVVPVGASSRETSEVEQKITSFVKTFYGGDEDVQIRLTNVPPHLRDRAKVRSVNFAKLPDGQGDGLCLVELDGRAGRERTAYVAFRVYKKKQLFVLRHGLRRGDILSADDLSEKETYLTGRTVYPSSRSEVVGKKLRRDLPAGTVLTPQVLEEQILVKSGDVVRIVAENSRLAIHANGKALDRGRMGQVIRVRNMTSGKEILCKVRGSDTVSVEF